MLSRTGWVLSRGGDAVGGGELGWELLRGVLYRGLVLFMGWALSGGVGVVQKGLAAVWGMGAVRGDR